MAQDDAELKAAAEKAGMTPEKFVALSGRVTLSEYERLKAGEQKATEQTKREGRE